MQINTQQLEVRFKDFTEKKQNRYSYTEDKSQTGKQTEAGSRQESKNQKTSPKAFEHMERCWKVMNTGC